MTPFLSIDIGINPNIGGFLGLLLTWHGVFTAVGIVAGVWLAVRIAATERVGIDVDTAYTLGMIVVACGIVGARTLYVVENYHTPGSGLNTFGDVFRINEGGISIYGAIIGGALGGWAWGLWKKLPCAPGADAAAFGMLIGLAIGRIGDIINGEHFAKTSSLPWAVTYSHPNSNAFAREAMHPAVAYEMLGDLVIMGLLALLWRRHPKSGVIFALSFVLYGVMRLCVSFTRLHNGEPGAEAGAPFGLGLSVPQFIALLTIPVAVILMIFFLIRREPERTPFVYGSETARRQAITRAERRRRMRGESGAPGGRGGPGR